MVNLQIFVICFNFVLHLNAKTRASFSPSPQSRSSSHSFFLSVLIYLSKVGEGEGVDCEIGNGFDVHV